jgi:hypothetical protein
MAVKSSKNGKVTWNGTPVPHSRGWSLDENVDENVYADSSTNGQKARCAGHSDATGSFNVFVDSVTTLTAMGIIPGAVGTLALYEDGTINDSLTVMIGSRSKQVEIEGGTQAGYSVNFGRTTV